MSSKNGSNPSKSNGNSKMPRPDFMKKDKDEKIVKQELEKRNILSVAKTAKYQTIDELYEQSQPSSTYYTLLILSVFIVTIGLLLENAPIVIGGMLVTPLLTPILVIALSISTAEPRALKTPLILLAKSTLITIVIAIIMTFLFGKTEIKQIFEYDLRTAILYFIVASVSGVAATFAWVRKEVSAILPGVSIAVALVPPLSLVGLNFGVLNIEAGRYYLLIYILNLVGIIVGSLIVFSLLGFHGTKMALNRKVKEEEKIESYKQAESKAKKAVKKMQQVQKNIQKAIEIEEGEESNKE